MIPLQPQAQSKPNAANFTDELMNMIFISMVIHKIAFELFEVSLASDICLNEEPQKIRWKDATVSRLIIGSVKKRGKSLHHPHPFAAPIERLWLTLWLPTSMSRFDYVFQVIVNIASMELLSCRVRDGML